MLFKKQVDALTESFNKKIESVEKDFKDLKKEKDEKIELLTGLTNLLLEASDRVLYKLRERKTSDYWFTSYESIFSMIGISGSSLEYESITIDELKTLGDYKTLTIGDETYFLAKKKPEAQKKKKVGRPRKTNKKK